MSNWLLKEYDTNLAELISNKYKLNPLLSVLIAQRAGENYARWLDPPRSVPNPFNLPDILTAIEVIKNAEFIGIFSDYDADGIVSAVMWKEFLIHIGKKVEIYIPDRKVGYGPSIEGVNILKATGIDTLLFLDCGTDCHKILTTVKLPIVVIDHHLVKEGQLPVNAFVNPYRHDAHPESPFLGLCTAALSLLVIAAIDRKYYPQRLYDLAAVATISDMMCLSNFNRSLVKQGLEYINCGSRPMLLKLATKYAKKITAQDIAFFVAPKINAAGRMDHAKHALNVFELDATDESIDALIELNIARQQQEAEIISSIDVIDDSPTIVLYDPEWNLGIVGIVAAKIKDKYNKPTFVLTKAGEYIKGSVRSTSCIDIAKWIQYAISAGVIVGGGGHKCAGGITLLPSQLDSFIEFTKSMPNAEPSVQNVDIITSISGLKSIESFDLLEPFGNGNPTPKFLIPGISIAGYTILKDIHARVRLSDGNTSISVMIFKMNIHTKALLQTKEKVDILLEYNSGGYVINEILV